ncbi:hypothetical protein LOK49_LG13G01152 [Camellia lanceoleosa]|uniref:Uncharacterized protein n=1 Tax=Camellia lanceoleosa TaxID=1840588 RepID=A0ACC0FM90_9ERIC|nr:hypothetical protein LOK49_LG13G01152 [Camellia lanceoleosa]
MTAEKSTHDFGIREEDDREELGDFVRGKSDYDDSGNGKTKKFEKDGIGSSKKREKKLKSKSEMRDGSKLKLKKVGDSSEQSRDQNGEVEVKEMWDTIVGGDSKEDQDGVRTLGDDNFIDDTGVDPTNRYDEPRSPGDAPQVRILSFFRAWGIPLADPPSTNQGLLFPNSSLSSMSAFSPKDQCDLWSPGFRKDSSFDVRLDNPFHVQGLKEFSGPYSTMVEVPCICRDSQKLGDIEDMLQNFRSLIGLLEEVDPRKMKYERKLAFWINIHNALVMHAFLAYRIPQNNIKVLLVSLVRNFSLDFIFLQFYLIQVAYNVRGHVVSTDTIQNSILGCACLVLDRPINVLENRSDLIHIRIYTPKRVFQELEVAKEEYIWATFGVRKD